MTIYILDNDPKKCAEALDDRSLEKMIRSIALALCNVHHAILGCYGHKDIDKIKNYPDIPLPYSHKKSIERWAKWAGHIEGCKGNYIYLAKLGNYCCVEYNTNREILKNIKYYAIITWLSCNIPNLPFVFGYCGDNRPVFPLVIPKKYWEQSIRPEDIYLSYRNYYKEKLKKEDSHVSKIQKKEREENEGSSAKKG